MLVILSDLHLTDGSTATNVNGGAFRILGREIVSNAKDNNADEIHLVLLGDIFDLVRTDWWFNPANVSKTNRPWNGQIDPATGMNTNAADVERQFTAILDKVLDEPGTKDFINVINGLSALCGKPVRISYVRGNHDRVLNNFPGLESKIAGRFPGLAVTFTDRVVEPAYGVLARHGHEWDDNCSARLLLQEVLQPKSTWQRLDPAINQVMAIGEVITAELMSGLVFNVSSQDPLLASIVARADTLRPSLAVFEWLDWETSSRLTKGQQTIVAKGLLDALDGVLSSSLAEKWDDIQWDWVLSGDITDQLTKAYDLLKVLKYKGLRECAKLVSPFLHKEGKSGDEQDPFYNGAREEIGKASSDIQYVVYGHTHKARHDCFAGYPMDRVRMYINTGTYVPLLERADDEWSFAQAYQMTMAFFYKDGEDDNQPGTGPSLDLWNGIKRKRY
jgi:UDP-2,3-diacylglucosamine pyrophosphatase LpxH